MSIRKQGNKLVLRDASGKVVSASARPANQSVETWRKFLLRITDNGHTIYEKLVDLATGKPVRVELPDGRIQVETPSFEVQRAAAMNILEMVHGKAVAQTEIIKAEKEAVKDAQLKAMSQEQLMDIIQAQYRVLDTPKPLDAGERSPTDGAESNGTGGESE